MIKGGSTTMWSLWTANDPDAVQSIPAGGSWPRIPDANMIRQAMREVGEAKPYADPKDTSGLRR
jgi:hypothetical protein